MNFLSKLSQFIREARTSIFILHCKLKCKRKLKPTQCKPCLAGNEAAVVLSNKLFQFVS